MEDTLPLESCLMSELPSLGYLLFYLPKSLENSDPSFGLIAKVRWVDHLAFEYIVGQLLFAQLKEQVQGTFAFQVIPFSDILIGHPMPGEHMEDPLVFGFQLLKVVPENVK